ncbi:MAG: hypothetical protein JXL97_03195 [Bacteroidales bacterium]|nr:hypothetical protein [Bacteroidales bacterium]
MCNFFKNIILIFFLLSNLCLSAQYVYEWNDYYGGDGMDEVSSMVKTYDGNIFIVGTVKDTTDAMWLVKINTDGIRLWSKLYAEYPLMRPTKIIETKDKNLLITGIISEDNSAPHKIWVIKLNSSGEILWEKLYPGNGDAFSTDMIETFDKGILISGYTAQNIHLDNDWYVLKLDSLGNFVWDKSFGSPYDDRATSVTELYDSTIIVVGYISYSYGSYKKGSITKFTADGVDLWADDIKIGRWSTANSISSTSDSCFVVAAEVKKGHFMDFSILILKMNPQGDTVWTREIQKPMWEHPVSIIETYDKGYAIAYTSKKDGVGNTNVAVMKLSPRGEIAWEKIFTRKSDDYASDIIEDANNGLVIGASTYTIDKAWNFGIVKFKSLEMSDMKFISPIAPIATIYTERLPVSATITGYKKPVEVKIYVNMQHITTITNFEQIDHTSNQYSWNNEIPLNYGLNVIDFIVTDYKNYKFVKSKKIYYLPNSTPHW